MNTPSIGVEHVVGFFESLTPASLSDIARIYADEARFKDPFNDVQGAGAIRAVFEHMFRTLDEPRFVVTKRVVDGRQCFLVWEFHFRFRSDRVGRSQVIHGGSYLQFGEDGRIEMHRDYWDAAEELYEKIPVLGSFMRWLRRRAAG